MPYFFCNVLNKTVDHMVKIVFPVSLGRFRTSTKTITITNTSLLRDVPNEHDFVDLLRYVGGHFPLANAIPFDYLKNN
jgi:hypothetical protein